MTSKQQLDNLKYKYELNSNLVLSQKHNPNEQPIEPGVGDGSGQTLAGKKLANFGDRVAHEKPIELQQKALKKLQDQKTKDEHLQDNQLQTDILHVQIQSEQLLYKPRTRETKAFYEQMLSIMTKLMGDQPLEVIQDALDETIAIIKSDISDAQRKVEISALVENLSDLDFQSLNILGQSLSDYQVREQNATNQPEEVQVDPEMNFSGSEESDFEDVFYAKYTNEGENQQNELEEAKMRDERADAEFKEVQLIDLSQYDHDWMQRFLNEVFEGAKQQNDLKRLEAQIMDLLGQENINQRDCEKKLLGLIGHKNFAQVRLLLKQRSQIYYGTLYNSAESDSKRAQVLSLVKKSQFASVLLKLTSKNNQQVQMKTSLQDTDQKNWQVTDSQIKASAPWLSQNVVDLDKIKFQEGARLMSNKKCHLPSGSKKDQKQGYDEISVPAIRHVPKSDEKLIPIAKMPEWTQNAFPQGMTTLNVIQSKLYEKAFKSPDNLLVCAPTGAGKTNIAMLTILQCLESRRKSNNTFDLKSFKIVYVAPMKALVSEVVGNFQRRLESYGIQVKELTGDTHLTRQQIDETQIIVTTPEKWDIITRKSGERAYTELVRLLIIDEIHLLHDTRGPVLEAIVARTIRQIEQTTELVRIVALSATLPNYQDVAAFLRVKKSGLFYFDNSYRPVPLEQIYIGISEKKAIKRLILMNEILYEKVIERAGKNQILVFTHSRKETARTAKVVRDTALQHDQLSKFLKDDSASKELLLTQVEKCDSQDLKDVLPFGIGIHHAGMTKRDRKMVEDLFAAGFIQLLCSTATLAWGVNLPAHTVILKGTQIYSPEQGKWIELSPQDVLQMMGRAGRPQYDTVGEGIIITTQAEMQYYLSLNNMQLPIESQMISQLADQMSAEVVLGTVSNVKEAVNWLSYTYLYVRMLRNPSLYGIDSSYFTKEDPTLIAKRHELVHSAANLLQKSHMIKYEQNSGSLQSTALGKIAAHYYIRCESMQIYADSMKPHMSMIDIFRLFSLSKEFQYIPIRENEKAELIKFVERVPIPVKGSLDEPSTKINILLQAYISQFKMEGFDINADTVYVSQSASRIMRALFEISLKKGWASLSDQLLNLCKICEKRLWNSMTPLRQFSQMPNLEEIAKKLERKVQFQLHHLYELNQQQLGEIVGNQKFGKTIQSYINKIPKFELDAYVQPLTKTIIRVELDLKVYEGFTWDTKYHGTAEPFYVFVTDCDNEQIMHVEQFILREKTAHDDHKLSFTVALHEPMPPQYFIKVVSDRWMHSETKLPISFKHLILPDKFPAPTAIENMQPKLVKNLQFEEVEKMYFKDSMKQFNQIQSQVFEKIYCSRDSVFVGAPSGSGLLTIAELAIFNELKDEQGGKILYIAPKDLICRNVYQNWQRRMNQDLGLNVALLDDSQPIMQQIQQIDAADVVISSPKAWESISRKWRQRKVIHQVTVVIFDFMQLLDSDYEIVASRCRLMQNELKDLTLQGKTAPRPIRIIGLSCPIANGKDVAGWLGVSTDYETGGYFNFAPTARQKHVEAVITSFDQFTRASRHQAMTKPAFNSIKRTIDQTSKSQAIVFVADRKTARLTALDFVQFCASEEDQKQFVVENLEQEVLSKFSEQTLQTCLQFGIGFVHDGMTEREIHILKSFYKQGLFRILIVIQSHCWDVADLTSSVVIVLDVEKYDGVSRRYVEYDIPTLLQMQSVANQEINQDGVKQSPKFHLMVYSARRDYFVKFLQEPMPLESQLAENLQDPLNTEIVAGTITNKQEAVDWLTLTFLFRRLAPNPNYYNLNGRTPQILNDFISQLIEDTVEDLVTAKCIEVDEENEFDLKAANMGRIAAFFGVSYQTMSLFAKNLGDEKILSQKLKALLQILSQASEFSQLQIRDNEEALLMQIAQYCTYPPAQQIDATNISQKTSILLQAHFDRRPLPVDLGLDLKFILKQVVNLLHAMTDVISTNEHLNGTLQCMELSQMCVQAMWYRQSPLLQLPGFDQDLIDDLKKQKVEDISDFMNMDDDLRQKILQIQDDEMVKLATVCNRFPAVEMSFTLNKKSYEPEDQVVIDVLLSRAEDDEESLAVFDQPVFAQYYPSKKFEDWWLVVGHPKRNKLFAIKKVTGFRSVPKVQAQLKFNLYGGSDFLQDGQSVVGLRLYLICDSYVGADLQEDLKISCEAIKSTGQQQ